MQLMLVVLTMLEKGLSKDILIRYINKSNGYIEIWCPGPDLNRHGVSTEGF